MHRAAACVSAYAALATYCCQHDHRPVLAISLALNSLQSPYICGASPSLPLPSGRDFAGEQVCVVLYLWYLAPLGWNAAGGNLDELIPSIGIWCQRECMRIAVYVLVRGLLRRILF